MLCLSDRHCLNDSFNFSNHFTPAPTLHKRSKRPVREVTNSSWLFQRYHTVELIRSYFTPTLNCIIVLLLTSSFLFLNKVNLFLVSSSCFHLSGSGSTLYLLNWVKVRHFALKQKTGVLNCSAGTLLRRRVRCSTAALPANI